MSTSRYAVPLAQLDAQVPLDEQTTTQAEPDAGQPVPWALGVGAVPAAGGGGGDGDGD